MGEGEKHQKCGFQFPAPRFVRNPKPAIRNRAMKGQAAVEYLMNYSWAILVLALVIGAIAFSGVFNPNYFVMEECYMGPSFNCHDQLIITSPSSTRLVMNVTNGLGYPIKLASIGYTTDNLGLPGTNTTYKFFSGGYMDNGNSTVITMYFNGSAQPQRDAVRKIILNVSYYICAEEVNPECIANSTFMRSISGRVITRVLQQ